ncbi:MAG: hypothetical protein ACK49X_01560, partial [Akkermansiaceae bacterium]
MLTLLVALPILAFIAILLGAPARKTALAAAAINLILGLGSVFCWREDVWNFSLTVLEKPELNLSFGYIDAMSLIMVLLSVIVTFAAVHASKAPEG